MDSTDKEQATGRAPGSGAYSGNGILKPIRQLIVFVLGASVLVVGIAMVVLPGPATVVIPVGLAILATEFAWARVWLNHLKRRAREVADWTAASLGGKAQESPSATPEDDAARR